MGFFDFDDGDFCITTSDNTAMDSDGNLMIKKSDNTAMDLDSGEIHFISSWDED